MLQNFAMLKKVVCDVADKLIQESEFDMKYHVGTMIEIMRNDKKDYRNSQHFAFAF